MKYTAKKPMSLMDALQEMAPDSSKSKLREWLKFGRVLVDGKPVKIATTPLEEGQEVSIDSKSQKINGIEILYEDRDLVVINKPAGLLSVSTDFETGKTAHSLLKEHFNKKVYVVHRLDQETSGVMLFAFTKQALDGLKKQFADHSILRQYAAVVEGKLGEKEGTWDAPLLEDDQYYVRVNPNGERAVSHYRVVRQGRHTAAIEVTLETGKKNQIRVHCQHAGHPVVGDRKYGSKIDPLHRLGLHAEVLAFEHPITGKRMTFTCKKPF